MSGFDRTDESSRLGISGVTHISQPALTVPNFGVNFLGQNGLLASDFAGPSVSLVSPTVGTLQTPLNVQFDVSDSGAGVEDVTVWLDTTIGTLLAYEDAGFISGFTGTVSDLGGGVTRYQLTNGVPGVYDTGTWHARAVDKAGNVTETSWAYTTQAAPVPDTTPPDIQFATFDGVSHNPLSNGDSLAANAVVSPSFADPNLNTFRVWVSADGGTPELAYDGFSFSAGYSGSRYSDSGRIYLDVSRDAGWAGSCVLSALAGDYFGNEDTASVSFTAPPSTPADSTPPVVSNVSPTPGTTISPSTPITMDVTDNRGLALVMLIASFPGTPAPEVVYDGNAFSSAYLGSSSVSSISGGYHFSLLRNGGWPATPTVIPYVLDTSGNENS